MDSTPAIHQSSPTKPTTAVFLQDACLQHRYIRSRDTSNIVEHPERVRAVKLGVAAAVARLEGELGHQYPSSSIAPSTSQSLAAPSSMQSFGSTGSVVSVDSAAEDLAAALGNLNIASSTPNHNLASAHPVELALSSEAGSPLPLRVLQSSAKVDILNNAAVKFVHGDIEGDIYLEKLRDLTKASLEKIKSGESEIPEGWSQGDLYLCPQSLDAMQGALGTVCEAVDTVLREDEPTKRAFVAIRPPGHHCGEDTPSGFCFLNNVAVGAAHAHLKHGIKRVLIFDIDLHHGNGTQSIIWQINEETYRTKIEGESAGPGAPPPAPPGLQVYYGSVHDVLSYPCEDGKPALVQAASVSIHGPHGQYIENIHLEPYESETQFFDVLYKGAYSRLLIKAKEFIENTGGGGNDVLVFISAGFDASEHEYSSMSRHHRKVPTSFFHRFTIDACAFASQYARGRVVSVLEGGYSDKALLSGAMAHVVGLVDADDDNRADFGLTAKREVWWGHDTIATLSKLAKKPSRRTPRSSGAISIPPEPWIERTASLLNLFDPISNYPASANKAPRVPLSTRVLRTRSPNPTSTVKSPGQSPRGPKTAGGARGKAQMKGMSGSEMSSFSEDSEVDVELPAGVSAPEVKVEAAGEGEGAAVGIPTSVSMEKKLPRVVLKLGPKPGAT